MSAGCRYFLCSECCKKKILDAKLDQWVNITDRIGPHYKADVVYKWLISKLCRFDPFLILRKYDVNIHICVMDEVSFCQRFLERCVGQTCQDTVNGNTNLLHCLQRSLDASMFQRLLSVLRWVLVSVPCHC